MKRSTRILIISVLTVTAACTQVFGGPGEPVAVPFSADKCRIEAGVGDKVEMAERGGVLTLTYDVALSDYKRVGHISMVKGGFKLLLKEPLVLSPSQLRIMFDGMNIRGDNSLRPLIQDEKGELLSYEPHALWALKKGTIVPVDQWVRWSSCMFYTSEAGGATQNIFDSAGGDGDSWPTGKLRFLGFEGRMTKNVNNSSGSLSVEAMDATKAERRKGVFNLARVEVGGERVPETDPAMFADMLLKKKGKARVDIQIRSAFQSLPYLEKSVALDYDPADPVSRHQEIRFEVGPVKNSWITCGVTEADGTASTIDFRWEKNLPPGAAAPQPVNAATAPSIGLMRINPAAHTIGVYKPGDPLCVDVRIFKKEGMPQPVKLSWTLTPYGYEDVLESGEAAATPKDGGSLDVPVQLNGDASRNAYTLVLSLADASGKELDRQSYVIGVENSKPQAYTARTGMLRGRDFVKKASYFRTSYNIEIKKKKQTEALAHFAAMLDESVQMTSYVTYMIDLADFEILPGVYDFSLLDQIMDAAADRGCAITVRVAHVEMRAPYRWMPYTLPRNFDGAVIPGHAFYGAFDFADQSFVSAWFKAFETLHARYKSHPAFQGYFLLLPAGEWALPDEPWMGNFAGYAWSDAELFRTFLKENRKLSLEQLNTRWGTTFKDWKEVMSPMPDFAIGKKPDLRPCWLDFSEFRLWLDHWWFPAASAHIRTFDKDHVVIDYGGQGINGEPEPGIVGNADYLHNGGNHVLKGEETLTKAWDEGQLGWITEPHHPTRWAAYGDPGQKGWVLDWSVFVMTAQAGGGGANLHVYYFTQQTLDLVAHYGAVFAYDRFETFKPILRELHGAKLQSTPKQVAVMQDTMTLMLKHRTIFAARMADLRQWFELLKLDSVDHEFYRKDNEANYKLVVMNPLDEVVSAESLDAAVRMANNGALLVLSAKTGRYCPEKGTDEYPLLRALGIPAPAGAYETAGDGAVAKVTADSAFFANGADLKFYSHGDMRNELSDPAYGKGFWQWPYRWIPESDYFGSYKNNKIAAGQTLAVFPDGGAAVTLHEVGKGKALVFWGVPDMKPELLKGMMGRIAQSAGVVNPRAGNPIPYALEADHKTLKRHYALLYHETPGDYTQKLPGVPDGRWFIDEMVGDQKLGVYTGEELRRDGIKLLYIEGYSPLKILRMIPENMIQADWSKKYRMPVK
jgi:hypothetical protein